MTVTRISSGGPWEETIGYSRVVVARGWDRGQLTDLGGELVAGGMPHPPVAVPLTA